MTKATETGRQKQQQIPFGDDNKKMTTRKGEAETK
jgi:hypothetical protein